MQKMHKGALAENEIKAFSYREDDFQLIFYYHIFFICNSSFYSCIEQSCILSLMTYVTILICCKNKFYMLNCPFMSFHKIKRCCLYDMRQTHPSIVLASSKHIINCVCSGSTQPDKVCEINLLECWLPRWLSLNVSVPFISGVLSPNSNCQQ